MTPIITLTTDFGLADQYVGAMKGVLLSKCTGVCLVDITHEIPPFSIYAGTYAIAQAAPYFPARTIHLVIVDPGVGTSRRPLLIEALDQLFIAPDNGVLSLLLRGAKAFTAREISNQSLWPPNPSSTFHGRDIFAPVAAALASHAICPNDVGPLVEQIFLLPDLEPLESSPGLWSGRLLSVDRFGNAVTNFKTARFPANFSILARQHQLSEFRQTFGSAGNATIFLYPGSSGYWEIGMNRESAAAHLELLPGDPLSLRDTIG